MIMHQTVKGSCFVIPENSEWFEDMLDPDIAVEQARLNGLNVNKHEVFIYLRVHNGIDKDSNWNGYYSGRGLMKNHKIKIGKNTPKFISTGYLPRRLFSGKKEGDVVNVKFILQNGIKDPLRSELEILPVELKLNQRGRIFYDHEPNDSWWFGPENFEDVRYYLRPRPGDSESCGEV